MRASFILILCIYMLYACDDPATPKPRGYFKVDFPQKEYVQFNDKNYPYSFEYPAYGKVIKDSTFFDTIPENPYWINIYFPGFNSVIYLSYKQIDAKNQLNLMVKDAFKMTGKHSIKASFIDEIPINESGNKYGFIFDVGGNAATGKQFYVTDSVRHFIRGALYFDATPNYDSIQPSEQFLYKDMQHLIRTLQWKN